jgi:hypothetical protein
LSKSEQSNILTFSEAIRSLTPSEELSIWSCGDVSKLVGNRLMKMAGQSETGKTAVLIFDRLVEFTVQKQHLTAMDHLFKYESPLTPREIKGQDFKVGCQSQEKKIPVTNFWEIVKDVKFKKFDQNIKEKIEVFSVFTMI